MESVRFEDASRIVSVNPEQSQGLGELYLEMRHVAIEASDQVNGANGALVVSPSGPLPGTTFRLVMESCRLRVNHEMDHDGETRFWAASLKESRS